MNTIARNRTGVLLVNLGSPEAPEFFSIRRYLREFLSDSRVIETNRMAWWLILNGFILNLRPFKLVKLYRSIWTNEGSPLKVESLKQIQALQEKLGQDYVVSLGMRYGQPSLYAGLQMLQKSKVSKIIVLPLYPQYAGATTGSAFDAVTRVLQGWRYLPELKFISDYHSHPTYLQAMKIKIEAFWAIHGKPQQFILSFHGLPKSYCEKGDPYGAQCQKTAQLLAESLGLLEEEWAISFQSRVGKMAWLTPYTEVLLKSLPGKGIRHIHVFCPGFSVDCLETLEEIEMRNKAFFLGSGGKSYQYIPALNSTSEHIQMMEDLILTRE